MCSFTDTHLQREVGRASERDRSIERDGYAGSHASASGMHASVHACVSGDAGRRLRFCRSCRVCRRGLIPRCCLSECVRTCVPGLCLFPAVLSWTFAAVGAEAPSLPLSMAANTGEAKPTASECHLSYCTYTRMDEAGVATPVFYVEACLQLRLLRRMHTQWRPVLQRADECPPYRPLFSFMCIHRQWPVNDCGVLDSQSVTFTF